jgi:hypothetical protein
MALSRALRDHLRKENGMRKKTPHSEDTVDINQGRKRPSDMERKRANLAMRNRDK